MTTEPTSKKLKTTPLHDRHLALNARMAEFGGFDLPVYYKSILEEHRWVREFCGVFDVSHLGELFVHGLSAFPFLQRMIPTQLSKIGDGQILYTVLLNGDGGVLDDILIYRKDMKSFYLIVNAAGIPKVLRHLKSHTMPHVHIDNESDRCACVAIQGPGAVKVCDTLFKGKPSQLEYYRFRALPDMGSSAWISRTGYTGEDGFEIFANNEKILEVWDLLMSQKGKLKIQSIGLGARNTLRLEAGNGLYGVDLDETQTPFEARLGWLVDMSKEDFIGKDTLAERKKIGFRNRLCGFKIKSASIARGGYPIYREDRQVGVVTSGSFSPTLNYPIGLGYVEADLAKVGTQIEIEIHKKQVPAEIVKLPFVPLRHK